MKPEEINKALAEKVMGWIVEDTHLGICYTVPGKDGTFCFKFNKDWDPYHRIDHAWMVEEAIGESKFQFKYAKCLLWEVHKVRTMKELTVLGFWYLIHATPEQRCLAALKAVKEVESEKK